MELDRNGLEVLDRRHCLALLASAPVARIALSVQALPVILPVNFVIDGDDIIIRTTDGTKTESALRGAVVAIEADDYDTLGHTGWSVLVRGRSRFVDDPREVERLSGLWVRAWGIARTDRWIAISMEDISGRRIHHVAEADHAGRPSGAGLGAAAGRAPSAETELLAWRAWGAVRADLHTTAAEPRMVAARPNVTWPSDRRTDPARPDGGR